MRNSPLVNLPDELLIEIYEKSIELELDSDFVSMVKEELDMRGLA